MALPGLPITEPLDYNARDPDAGVLNHARAFGNVSLVNWWIWQMSWFRGADWVRVTRDSLARNLRGFTLDEDELQQNFFGHPYHGGLLFTSARAAGLGFWESAPYALAGSLQWELFGEREHPSTNDLIVTTLTGIMLGEFTYRLSSELLDDGESGFWRLAREVGAFAVSPMRGFNRLYTGRAWRDGPPPVRYPVEAELHVGLDRVRLRDDGTFEGERPAALFAVDVSYGDLLPRTASTIDPFEFFELYAAAHLFNSRVQGAQLYASGLLHGVSWDISDDRGSHRDNNVLGFGMTYDFQGANFATYGGVGLGATDYLVLRFGSRKWLQLGAGLDFVPIIGVTASEPADLAERGYEFGTGGAAWATAVLNLDRFGTLRLRSRHYLSKVIEGDGQDYVGAARASYEVDAVRGVGVGFAPMVVYVRHTEKAVSATSLQQQMQLYVRVHN